MTRRADTPIPAGDLLAEAVPWIAGPAALLPMFPGFLLCVPGFVLAALVLIPVVAGAVVVAVVAAIVEVPVLLVRRVQRRRNQRR